MESKWVGAFVAVQAIVNWKVVMFDHLQSYLLLQVHSLCGMISGDKEISFHANLMCPIVTAQSAWTWRIPFW
jgi:hypothetical protein